jgi:tetratricopeptide (TPR) repeat protein
MKKILLFTVVIIAFCSSVTGQFVYDYVKAADNYFAKEDYASAAEYYEKYLNEKKAAGDDEFNPYTPQKGNKKKEGAASTREQAIYNLAECYRHLNYPSKAEPNYKKTLDASPARFPLAEYHYATQQRALAKYAEAEQSFTSFLAGYKTNDAYRKNAERELKNLQFIQAQLKKKDLKYYTLRKAGGALNTTGASYAPAWLNENTLLFTSTRPLDSTIKSNKYTNRVFQAVYTETGLGDIQKASLPEDKDMHQGVVSVTPDGNTIFLTRWGMAGDKKTANIYTSTRSNDSWNEPKKAEGGLNAES